MTSFTLSALGYADYTKYRLLNLFLFVLQICGYLRFVISLVALPQHSGIKIYCDMLRSRVQGSNLLVPTDHGARKKHHHISDSAFLSSFTLSVYQSSPLYVNSFRTFRIHCSSALLTYCSTAYTALQLLRKFRIHPSRLYISIPLPCVEYCPVTDLCISSPL